MLDNPEAIVGLLRDQIRTYTVESLQAIYLNTRRRMIGMEKISQGTLDTIMVHAREVFANAIVKRASANRGSCAAMKSISLNSTRR